MSNNVSDVSVSQVDEKPTQEFLSEQDKYALEMVKMKRALAIANAEKALAQNEASEMTYNNAILRLSIKYNLHEHDLITEQGEIKRGPQGSGQ